MDEERSVKTKEEAQRQHSPESHQQHAPAPYEKQPHQQPEEGTRQQQQQQQQHAPAPDEETSYILLDLGEYAETNLLSTCQAYSLIGLDTETPILKLDNHLFEGRYEDTIGTHIFFAENQQPVLQQQPLLQQPNQYRYTSHTTKTIKFKRIQLPL